MPHIDVAGFDFSYSGLKSHMINLIHNSQQKKAVIRLEDVAASFQKAAFEQIFEKTKQAINAYQPKQLLIAGGVSANQYLRKEIKNQINIPVIIPDFEYCTDNAAMIGIAAYYQWQKTQKSFDLSFNGDARLKMISYH